MLNVPDILYRNCARSQNHTLQRSIFAFCSLQRNHWLVRSFSSLRWTPFVESPCPEGSNIRAEADKMPQGDRRDGPGRIDSFAWRSVPKLNAVDRASQSAQAFSSPAILRRGEHLEYHPIPSCPHGPRRSTGILVFLCSQPTSLVLILQKVV